jgi:hypothetical protein
MDQVVMLTMLAGAVGVPGTSAVEQERWIDSAADHPKAYTAEQAWLTCWVLAQLARDDRHSSRREAELHAIVEIVEWHPDAQTAVTVLAGLDHAELSLSEQEYLDLLLPAESRMTSASTSTLPSQWG